MSCNCNKTKNEKIINKLNKIMKKNVTYKLKDDVASSTWIRFGREKIFVEHITQSTLENLHRNGYDSVEIIENKPTYTNDKKKASKKK
jgi:hypothetical protein|tara:strand:- start:872 stop:1135 length:264 start_codon:yes stop_codon:yes gene_type:complete